MCPCNHYNVYRTAEITDLVATREICIQFPSSAWVRWDCGVRPLDDKSSRRYYQCRRSDEVVDRVRQAFIRNPKKSISWPSPDLQLPQNARKKRTNCVALSFYWLYSFGILSLGLCERPGLEPMKGYAGWTQDTDHCSSCKCYKEGMLQRVWQEVDCRWDVCRATECVHC
jgi:hypothetical protein